MGNRLTCVYASPPAPSNSAYVAQISHNPVFWLLVHVRSHLPSFLTRSLSTKSDHAYGSTQWGHRSRSALQPRNTSSAAQRGPLAPVIRHGLCQAAPAMPDRGMSVFGSVPTCWAQPHPECLRWLALLETQLSVLIGC